MADWITLGSPVVLHLPGKVPMVATVNFVADDGETFTVAGSTKTFKARTNARERRIGREVGKRKPKHLATFVRPIDEHPGLCARWRKEQKAVAMWHMNLQ